MALLAAQLQYLTFPSVISCYSTSWKVTAKKLLETYQHWYKSCTELYRNSQSSIQYLSCSDPGKFKGETSKNMTVQMGCMEEPYCLQLTCSTCERASTFLAADVALLHRQTFVSAVQVAIIKVGMVGRLFNGHSHHIRAAITASTAWISTTTIKALGHQNSLVYQGQIWPSSQDLAQLSKKLVQTRRFCQGLIRFLRFLSPFDICFTWSYILFIH